MKGIKTARAAVVALALLALVVSATGAFATTNVSTRLSLALDRSESGDVLSGKVRSKSHACEKKRKLRIHHRAVSEQQRASVVAKLKTNSKGKWTYKPKKNDNGDRFAAAGNYRVKVGDVKVHGDDGGIRCKSRTSSTMFIG